MSPLFADRAAAGRALAPLLMAYAGRDDVVVLALPRGGVPVAWEVAQALGAPLDVLVVSKLRVPHRPDRSMGAIAGAGEVHVDPHVVQEHGVSPQQLDEAIAHESLELIRRRALYCGRSPPVPTEGCTVIVVDEGIATGASMQVALKALRSAKPDWVVVAVPVAPPEAQDRIGTAADDFVSVASPQDFDELGAYYGDYSPVRDDEVCAVMARAASRP